MRSGGLVGTLTLAALALAFFLPAPSGRVSAQLVRRFDSNPPQTFAKADTCRPFGSYASDCCCAPRRRTAISWKTRVIRRTRTIFRTKRAARGPGKRERKLIMETPIDDLERGSGDDNELQEHAPVENEDDGFAHTSLFRRHLCPVCPAAYVESWKRTWKSSIIFCCLKPVTVFKTRTIKRTRTRTRFKTRSVTRVKKMTTTAVGRGEQYQYSRRNSKT
jgi:hypothetical protein